MVMAESTGSRLDRIEEKLDKLTDAMVAMARAEEKIAGLQDDHGRMHERLNKHSEKLDDIERICNDNHRTICVINKLFWVVTVAVIGSIVTQLGVFS
jgi:DNA repair exonuclease SbcCD ATPase subunit